MASAFDAVLPLIEDFKEELKKLGTATQEIATARDGAKVAAEAAGRIASKHEELAKLLGKQQLSSLQDQENQLQSHLDDLTRQTATETTRQLTTLQQAGQSAQATIDKLLAEQPPLLAAIKEQHTKGVDFQKSELQKAAKAWADLLHQQMQSELQALRQVIDTLQANTRQQHDDLSAITNQLQVATGRITAFAEAMNAAKFLTKLESLEAGQRAAGSALDKVSQDTATALQRLDSQAQTHRQQTAADSQATTATVAALTSRLAASEYEQAARQTALLAALEGASAQNQAAARQLRLLQVVSLVLSAAVAGLVLYFKS